MAGFKFEVKSNLDEVLADMGRVTKEVKTKATVRALNAMVAQVKTQASKEIRNAGYNLKASRIKQQLKVRKASASALIAKVVASGRPIPLIEYGARQTNKGVSVSVLNGRKIIAEAFIATMPTGHKGVYIRKPNAKHKKMKSNGKPSWHALPIRELYGPAIPDAMANQAVQQALEALVADKLPTIFRREVKYLSGR